MSYVDHIIKYLSGELSPEEASSFEKELESNKILKDTFDLYASAYELTRHQLQKRDEEAFRTRLLEIVNGRASPRPSRKKGLNRRWFISAAVACAAALLLILLPFRTGKDKILSRFLQPETDPVILAINQDTRGASEPGIAAYRNGDYIRSMELLSARNLEEKDNRLIQLYLLLSSMELDRQQEVLGQLQPKDLSLEDLPDQALAWYTALAFIQSDNPESARELIHSLTEQEGPYLLRAIKLEKVLLK